MATEFVVKAGRQLAFASGRERAILYRQIGQMLQAGLPIERVFNSAARTRRGALREALERIADRLRRGDALSKALSRVTPDYPGLFVSWETQFLAFGEISGHLPEFFLMVADQAEEAYEMAMAIAGGCAYPLLLLYLAVLSGPIGKLVTNGAEAYLLAVRGPVVALTLLLGLLLLAFVHPVSRTAISSGLRSVPLLGLLLRKLAEYRLMTALAAAWSAGVPLDAAWPMAAQASADPRFVAAAGQIAAMIRRGREIGPFVAGMPAVFGSGFRNAYQTGEATGKLDTELRTAARLLKPEIERLRKIAVRALTTTAMIGVAAFLAKGMIDQMLGQVNMVNQQLHDALQ